MTTTPSPSEDELKGQMLCQQTGEHYYSSYNVPGCNFWVRQCSWCHAFDTKDFSDQLAAHTQAQTAKARKDETEYWRQVFTGGYDNWCSALPAEVFDQRITELDKQKGETE